jgi:phosphate starvation-inducible protein PhoH
MACGRAVEAFQAGKVKRIVLTRPLHECDEEIGTLPGDLLEKVSDMMRPVLDALEEFLGKIDLDKMIRAEQIIIMPLAKLRGATLKEAFIILDEAQNATYRQLKMFLTRFGKGSQMIVCGDYTQSDLPYDGENSLLRVTKRFRPHCHKDVALVELTRADIVRDPLVQWFDDVLSDTPEQEKQHGWQLVPCPGCDKDVWYAPIMDDRENCLACPHCKELIELRDESGRINPGIVIGEPMDWVNAHVALAMPG